MTKSSQKPCLLRVGAAQFFTAGTVVFHRYQSGEIAIEIIDDEGDRVGTATCALVPYGAPHPGKFGLWLKGWSENEGVPQALADAGIVTLTGRHHRTGFAEAQHAELTELGREALAAADIDSD